MPNWSKEKREEMQKESEEKKENINSSDTAKSEEKKDPNIKYAKELIGCVVQYTGTSAELQNNLYKILHADDYSILIENIANLKRDVLGKQFSFGWVDRNAFYKRKLLIEEGEQSKEVYKEMFITELLAYIADRFKGFWRRLKHNHELMQELQLISLYEDKKEVVTNDEV